MRSALPLDQQDYLSLAGEEPFATGGLRDVFIHPTDPNLCIKVWRKDRLPKDLKAKKPFHRRWRKTTASFDENLHDWYCLKRIKHRNSDEVWNHIPRCHGFIPTDRGPGLVNELIRDHNGLISRSLLDILWETGDKTPFIPALEEFAIFWKSHVVPNRKLALYNLTAQEVAPGQYHLYIIDGFLNRFILTLQRVSKTYAHQKAIRQIKELDHFIDELLNARKESKKPGELGFLKRRI